MLGGIRSIAIVLLVTRSKLVLDFALSLHAIHLAVVVLYSRQVPRHLMWWVAMSASSALSVALGVWGCRYRELMPITFGGGGASRSTDPSAGPTDGGEASTDIGDEEAGFSRGRGRGRGRDGAGEYEMVQMKGDAES
jgi:hypothetical protein